LTPRLQQSLDSLQAVAFVPQANLDIDVTPGNPGATGLIGALIVAAVDESRRTKAQQASAGLVDALREFGFRERMSRQLDAEFARLRTPRVAGPVRLETTDSESQRRIIYDTSRASAVLFTSVSYKLVDAKLVVAGVAVMYPKAQKLMAFRSKPNNANPLDDGNAIYRKAFTYRSETIARDRIAQSLADGIANVAWQLASDMGHMAGSGDTARTTALPPVAAGSRPPGPVDAGVAAVRSSMPDSQWSGSYRCGRLLGPAVATGQGSFDVKADMSVQAGMATLVRGSATYDETLVGRVSSDGTLLLQGQGSLRNTPAQPWKTELSGRFDPAAPGRFVGAGRLMRMDGKLLRDCTVDLIQKLQ
jgi:hypothetical protein